LLFWTIHLQGLDAVLEQLGLLDITFPRDGLSRYIVETAGLLDLPGATIWTRFASRGLWTRFVTPVQSPGVEPTSGLPRSLLNLMADLYSLDIESRLLCWTPEPAEHVLQYHFWEAFRLSSLLNSRGLRHLASSQVACIYGDDEPSIAYTPNSDTESLVMRILSCIDSLRNAADDPFPTPLAKWW
jgi:hypothetical protein